MNAERMSEYNKRNHNYYSNRNKFINEKQLIKEKLQKKHI